tara:strand:+ start:752 stop:1486 length:735 start_codon:yes stop_codon:yes gene_type:complete
MNKRLKKYDLQAAELFRSSNEAILSTVSQRFDGFPFGSYVTYVSGRNRSIYLYASDIAEHTKNLKNDPKACITVSRTKDEEDKQNSARLTIMGNLKEVSKDRLEDCKSRFHKFLPESKKYSQMHDFKFYELKPDNIRWIGGFGEIAWLKKNNWVSEEPRWKEREQGMIEHMNDDHSNVIFSTLRGQHNIEDKHAEMFAMCIDGYYVLSKKDLFFIRFDSPCLTPKEVKDELVRQANEFRSLESN